jgi:hypothetical protein
MPFNHLIKRNVSNFPGWRTNRKIVVIESDDWGSIRMPSKNIFEKLEQNGLNLKGKDALRYNQNDTLATSSDLERLFEVLSCYKDKAGNNAVFTAVSVVANPDFKRIKESDFQEYFYEPFIETLKRYPGCDRSFVLWREGIDKKVFVPQMHGREHLNVTAWMRALRDGDKHTRLAFDKELWGFAPDQDKLPGANFLAAFFLSTPSELSYLKEVIKEGLDLFEKLFGYRAVYFVPPNGVFNNSLNNTLAENGIKFRSVEKIQYEPLGFGMNRRAFHYLGQKDKTGIKYITRNCIFEPSQSGKDWVDCCLNDIKTAFRWHKPAVISSHRVNYVGALNESNRDMGLRHLRILLHSILKIWPDSEFITTDNLGRLMN